MHVIQHSDEAKQKIRERALLRESIKRGEVELPPVPDPVELSALLEHIPWANVIYRVEHLNAVAEKTYQEIMSTPKVSPRLVEVLNQTAEGIAKETGGRQVKSQVEVSGNIDVLSVQASLIQKLEGMVTVQEEIS